MIRKLRDKDNDRKRRSPRRPLALEALEGRWVPAATVAGALPQAAVVAQSYSNTGTDIAASTVSEAGGYTFAQRFHLVASQAPGSPGGPFSANDALNQFFDELMSYADAFRHETLFGGAYNAIGVGPNGTLLPSAFGSDQHVYWQGNDLVFSETLTSGGSRYQISYTEHVGYGGAGGGTVTAVQAAIQFFSQVAAAQNDANFPGLLTTYGGYNPVAGRPTPTGSTTSTTTTTTPVTGTTGSTTSLPITGSTPVTTTPTTGSSTTGATPGTTSTATNPGATQGVGTTGSPTTFTPTADNGGFGSLQNVSNTSQNSFVGLTLAGKGLSTTGATSGQTLANPSGTDAPGALFGSTGQQSLGSITTGLGGLGLPLGSGGLGLNNGGGGINTVGQFTNPTNLPNQTTPTNSGGFSSTNFSPGTTGGLTGGFFGTPSNSLGLTTVGLTQSLPTIGSISGAVGPGFGYNGLGFGGLLNGTTAGPNNGGGIVGSPTL